MLECSYKVHSKPIGSVHLVRAIFPQRIAIQMDFRSLPTKLSEVSSPEPAKTPSEQELLSPGDRSVSVEIATPRNSIVDIAFGQEYDFVEPPPIDFFCPVTLELLVNPQQTTCCGNHLSLEAATKLQGEEKACPVCNEQNFGTVPDKHYRRRVLELQARCPHAGCDWIGEVRGHSAHLEACAKRPWDCKYCGLSCTFDDGEDMHWPVCEMFPEPCPNNCEVRSVARKYVKQHHTECSLELVACEMSKYGCPAMIPRKDVATHMKESEGQHLMSLAVLNYAQLQVKNERLAEIQQNMLRLQQTMQRMQLDLTNLNRRAAHIENHAAGGVCSSCTIHTFSEYSFHKLIEKDYDSRPFFSKERGYKFNFRVRYYGPPYNSIILFLGLLPGEYDEELSWPVKVAFQVEQLNQIGEQGHKMFTATLEWNKEEQGAWKTIDSYQMKYKDLEKSKPSVQYILNDTLKYRVHLQIS